MQQYDMFNKILDFLEIITILTSSGNFKFCDFQNLIYFWRFSEQINNFDIFNKFSFFFNFSNLWEYARICNFTTLPSTLVAATTSAIFTTIWARAAASAPSAMIKLFPVIIEIPSFGSKIIGERSWLKSKFWYNYTVKLLLYNNYTCQA
mgnify:CR=1 FL=1